MSFKAQLLSRDPFATLFDLPDGALAAHRAVRIVADAKPGFPCRISLRDAEPGEALILVNYQHQPADSPFQASHAIYVRTTADQADLAPDTLPPFFHGRVIALRAFDMVGMLLRAELSDGDEAAPMIADMLADDAVAYLHAHFAKPGFFACRIDRA